MHTHTHTHTHIHRHSAHGSPTLTALCDGLLPAVDRARQCEYEAVAGELAKLDEGACARL